MPSAKIIDIAKVMIKNLTKRVDYPIKETGIRPMRRFTKHLFLKRKCTEPLKKRIII